MRTGSWLWTAALAIALPSIFVGCGDDSPVGGAGGAGGGQGGEGNQNPVGGAPQGGEGVGGSGGAVPFNDDCETASGIDVAAGEEISVQGTLAGAADDVQTFCADDGTPKNIVATDVVYELTLADPCTLSLSLEGSAGMNAVLSARPDCMVDDKCANGSTGGTETMLFHADAGTLFVIVSDLNSTGATFQLTVGCATPECGDFVKDTGEDCDDGNTADGDGCDAGCFYEPTNPEIDNCAGALASIGTSIGQDEIVRISDSALATTIGAAGDENGSCQYQLDVTNAPDHVYKITPEADGVLTATLGLGLTGILGETDVPVCGADTSVAPLTPYPTGCYERSLYIRSACTDPTSELGCSEETGTAWWAVEETVINVTAGEDYFVFVDGYYDDQFGAGAYVLRLELN